MRYLLDERSRTHVQLAMPEGEEAGAVVFYEKLLGIPQVPKPSTSSQSAITSEGGSSRGMLRLRSSSGQIPCRWLLGTAGCVWSV